MSSPPLTESDLRAFITELPEWAVEQGKLIRHWEFDNFLQAIAFVNRVAQLAEQHNHHPDIDIHYNRVKLSLISHDSGGITARDTGLAHAVNSLA